MSSYSQAGVTQLRVIRALMLREIVGMSHGTLGMWGMLVRPTAMVLVVYFAGRATGLGPHGFPLFIFSLTGYLTWFAFIRCFGGVTIRRSHALLMFPHITTLDLALAKMSVELVIYSCVFLFIASLSMLFGGVPMPDDPLGVVLSFWSSVLLGISLGLVAVSIERFTTILDDFWRIVRLVGHALSGVFLLATDTPGPVLAWMQWNPLFHAVEWMRQSWWSSYQSPVANPWYIAASLVFLTAIALAFERGTRRFEI